MADLVKTLLIFTVFISLSSCLTIESYIEFDENLSGSISYDAAFSTLAADLEKIDRGGELIPFPLLEREVDKIISDLNGLSMLEREFSDDGSRYFARNIISFDSLDDLNAFTGVTFSSETSGSNRILTVIIFEKSSGSSVDSRVLDIVRSNFPREYIEVKIAIPGDIIQVEGATFSGSSVTFRITLLELLQSNENVQFSVEYR